MIYFLAPAYNEEANVAGLIGDVDAFARSHGIEYRLLIADDGSGDRTAEIVAECSARYPCEVLSYKPNQGPGEAFRRGFNSLLEQAKDGDFIVTLESDRTADLNLVTGFLAKAAAGADLVVASYYAKGGSVEGTAWHRKLLSRAANVLISGTLGVRGIHTYSSFFRLYRVRALRAVREAYGDFYQEKGFACVLELLVRMSKLGQRLDEVPMVLQGANRIGKSKMRVGRTIQGYLRVIARNVFTGSKKN